MSYQAGRAWKKYETETIELFKQLKKKDTEVAVAAFEVWDDLDDAALNLAKPVPALGDK